MLISDYKRVEYSHNPPKIKCEYCNKRRKKMIPKVSYWICFWCDVRLKTMNALKCNTPKLVSVRYRV